MNGILPPSISRISQRLFDPIANRLLKPSRYAPQEPYPIETAHTCAKWKHSQTPPHRRPTATGYLAIKDITPRPDYGPDYHPTFPIMLMRNIHTNMETPHMLLGYTGKDKAASDAIIKNGFTYRVFTTQRYNHASHYADNGKVLSLGIPLDKFVQIANHYNTTAYTVNDILSSPESCKEIQGAELPRGNVLGFETDDPSEGHRERASCYTPLRHLITLSSTLLDIKDPKQLQGNSLDAAILRDLDIRGQYDRDHSWIAQVLPKQMLDKLEGRQNFDFEDSRYRRPMKQHDLKGKAF